MARTGRSCTRRAAGPPGSRPRLCAVNPHFSPRLRWARRKARSASKQNTHFKSAPAAGSQANLALASPPAGGLVSGRTVKEQVSASANNHTLSRFGFSAADSDSGRRARGSHERAGSARKGRKKHVSELSRPNRSAWIVVEQNHNGIGKLMVAAFQIHANIQWNQ